MLGVPTELFAKILPLHTDRNCKPGFCFFLRILSHDLFMLRTYTFIDVDRRPEIETEVTGAELYRRVFSKTLFFCTYAQAAGLGSYRWGSGPLAHVDIFVCHMLHWFHLRHHLVFSESGSGLIWLSRDAFNISIPIPRTLRQLHKYGNE